MVRKIIKINEKKCNGCGLCATACHERAIGIVDGKAKLLRDDYCDGLGDCLPACPMDAISFEEREALPYDRAAVEKAMEEDARLEEAKRLFLEGCATCKSKNGGSCSGHCSMSAPDKELTEEKQAEPESPLDVPTQLTHWPVQIKLVPTNASYFEGADVLIAADCTAYAYGNFHDRFMKGRATLIGCPKLDEGDYTEKLTRVFQENNIKSVTLTRMLVPCCGGMERAVRQAVKDSGKDLPLSISVISHKGDILGTF